MMLHFTDRQAGVTAFPELRVEFGVSEDELGTLVSVVAEAAALSAMPSPWWSSAGAGSGT